MHFTIASYSTVFWLSLYLKIELIILNVIHVLFDVEGKLEARLISRSESDEHSVCGSEIQEITRNIMNLSCDFRFCTQGYSQRIRL